VPSPGITARFEAIPRGSPVAERLRALRFLVHRVEDLHRPLHVGDNGDNGGNATQVRFFTRGWNLRRVWDSGIIDRTGRNEDAWLAELIARDTYEAPRWSRPVAVAGLNRGGA
jgi:hypothetical protein